MDKLMVEFCKKIGSQIGNYCADTGQETLLHDLRRSKRLDKFLEVLARTKSKIESLSTEQNFYLMMDETNWREIKALISIFAKDQQYSVNYPRSKSGGLSRT